MYYYYMKKAITLLLVSSAMTLFTSVDAQDCYELGQDMFYYGTETGPCEEVVAGVCPSTCKDAVDSFHTTCSMEGATYLGDPYDSYSALNVFTFTSMVIGDIACKDVFLDKALEVSDTCQDWFYLWAMAASFHCSGDRFSPDNAQECPQFCVDMLDGYYDTCSPESTYASTDDDTISVYLSDTCSAYEDTKDFTGTDTTSDDLTGTDTTPDDSTDDTNAQDCDALFFSLSDKKCEVVAGVCPSTCKNAVDSFHTTCSMEGATYLGGLPYVAHTAIIALSLLKGNDDACKDVFLDKALEVSDTCGDWFSLLSAAPLHCTGDGFSPDNAQECPQFCMDMLDGYYGTCSPESFFATDDEFISVLDLSDTCSAYEDTKDFTGTDTTSDDLTQDRACGAQVDNVLDETETGPCKVVAGVCPSTCKDAVDSLHTTCSSGEAYYGTTGEFYVIALRGDDDACKGVFLDKALETADTCLDWAILLSTALFECTGDALECPQSCTDMLDGFYGTCSSESTYFSTNEDQSFNKWETYMGFVLSDTCSAYQDTKDFTGTDTTSDDFTGTDTTSAGASISLFATAVFVAVASIAISL